MLIQIHWDLVHTKGEIVDLYHQDLIFFLSLMNLTMKSVCHDEIMYSKSGEGLRDGVCLRRVHIYGVT